MASPSCSTPPLYLALFLVFFCFDVHSLQFNFPTFSNSDHPRLNWSNNSNIDNQALQITRNSGSSNVSHSSGQITYSQPLQLHHKSHHYLASFNTSFVTNMGLIPDGGTPDSGGGMTFMLSSKPAQSYLPNSFGQWLGLFDAYSTKKQAHMVAIELDTFKDSFDPDGNHVGIDVINGSVHSMITMSLSPEVLLSDMSTTGGIHTSVWIDYNGYLRTLDVYLANQGSHLTIKPNKPAISGHPIDLSEYLPDTVYVGFSASVGTILETHCVLEWHFNSTEFPKSGPVATILGSIFGGLVALTLLVLGVVALLRWRTRRAENTREIQILNHGPRKFTEKELKQATRGFSEEWKLGQGGSGEVFRGVIRYEGGREKEVAVKRLSKKSKQGEREFKAEVMSMGRMKHKNLVQLLGWRYGRSMMLVYEYMPNRSLDRWIKQGVEEVMGWERRYHVMKGVAEGLAYMHEGWEIGQAIVHRDLKPSNVMLDAEFNARIGDFGLAKLFDIRRDQIAAAQTANNDTIAGTLGYMAPEYMERGIISKEIDIYSMGVLAIDLVTGRCGTVGSFTSLLSCVLDHDSSTSGQQLQGVADARLHGRYDRTQLELLLKIGLACCQLDPSARPTIHDIINTLSTSKPINIACTRSMQFSSSRSAPASSSSHSLGSTSTVLTAIQLSAGR